MTHDEAVNASHECPVCEHYFKRRLATISMWIVIWADRVDVCASDLALRYRVSVHERHLAGVTLSTRVHTPDRKRPGGKTITVQRSCNGCGRSLGDATSAELDHAVAGATLPDVRLECGCYTEAVAA